MTTVNIDHCCDSFVNVVTTSIQKHCPLKKVRKRKRKIAPWLTPGLMKSIKRKNTLYRKYVANFTDSSKKKYTIYRNRLNALIKNAKQNYFREKIRTNIGNIKKTWGVINTALKKKKKTSIINNIMTNVGKTNDPNRITEAFNDYFINVGLSLANEIDNNSDVNFSHFLADYN